MPKASGWSAGVHVFDGPPKPITSQPKEPPFSYLTSSGYCELVLKQAQEALGRIRDTDFSDIFEGPNDERTEIYLKSLDTNERGALQEIARTPVEQLLKLGIVPASRAPAQSSSAWTAE